MMQNQETTSNAILKEETAYLNKKYKQFDDFYERYEIPPYNAAFDYFRGGWLSGMCPQNDTIKKIIKLFCEQNNISAPVMTEDKLLDIRKRFYSTEKESQPLNLKVDYSSINSPVDSSYFI